VAPQADRHRPGRGGPIRRPALISRRAPAPRPAARPVPALLRRLLVLWLVPVVRPARHRRRMPLHPRARGHRDHGQ
jgi:hypothetical protein